MSTASPRGSRTRGIFIGPLSNPKRDSKPERLTRVASAFCPRVEVAVLALVAEEIAKSGKDASKAMLAYESARAACTARPDMPPLSADMAGEAALGRMWVANIVAATRSYANHARIERKGPAIPAIRTWLENLGKAAAELVAAHNEPLDPLGKIVARADLAAHMPIGADLDEFMATARAIVGAVPLVSRALADEPGCKDGMAWDQWVVALTKVCRAAGLPTGASHDPESARADGEQSPFVSLVGALMRELPRGLRRHAESDTALAQAISRARDKAAERAKRREEPEIHSAE
ncbi:hypothetical protein [Methylocystis parvus]|uniref:Uncharacterized protein n=1 Tax=Methylocystis parvus TaxID=134 RepID=A0A6B8M6L7_9HYPH|nr:hypothetical protein [Methylocystis parvus]QGM97712.1 hypothetical protein F7D14_09690 [Methylocystis parvus]WBJ98352.1 hypothetical protein MMG94_09900 [Methylocystis parvus OBBP]